MKYWIAGILALVVVIGAVGYFVPLVEVAYAETIEYQDTETFYEVEKYTVTEPYEDIETVVYSVPYQDKEIHIGYYALEYNLLDDYVLEQKVTPDDIFLWVRGEIDQLAKTNYLMTRAILVNTDDTPGEFTVIFKLKVMPKLDYAALTQNKPFNAESLAFQIFGKEIKKEITVSIAQGVHKTIEQKFYEVDAEDNYYVIEDTEVVPGEKAVVEERPVTIFKDVEETRTIIKYREVEKTRQVEKQRPVTKQKTETRYKRVPLFESLFAG